MIDLDIVKGDLKNVRGGWVFLIETSKEDRLSVVLGVLKLMTEVNVPAIVLDAHMPYVQLKEMYENAGLNINKIFVLDTMTKSKNPQVVNSARVAYITNPVALNETILSLNEVLQMINKDKFVTMDSLDSFAKYSQNTDFAKFVHSILTTIRLNGSGGFLVNVAGEINDDLRSELAQFVDKVVHL
ncbi:hypothetical protein JW868_04570 [Candidatus Woesearchaeota archaeon]|nr:hypothetical protein [Candidatus Woesearchaeota archaeon]